MPFRILHFVPCVFLQSCEADEIKLLGLIHEASVNTEVNSE